MARSESGDGGEYRKHRKRSLSGSEQEEIRHSSRRESKYEDHEGRDRPRHSSSRRKEDKDSWRVSYRHHRSRSPHDKYKSHRRRSYSRDRRQHSDRRSPGGDHQHHKTNKRQHRSGSPSQRRSKVPPIPAPPIPYRRSKAPLPSQQEAYTNTDDTVIKPDTPDVEKQKPNFAPSGKLAAETNTVSGTNIVLKYNEPPESRKPPASQAWRLYVFKGKETLDTIELASRSCWLFGRERAVVDYTIEHPSCSKQHAVLQFRYVEKMDEFGDRTSGVKPYLIDLESANGTKVNGERMPDRRYIEIISGDVLGFGDSTREYVLMLPPGG